MSSAILSSIGSKWKLHVLNFQIDLRQPIWHKNYQLAMSITLHVWSDKFLSYFICWCSQSANFRDSIAIVSLVFLGHCDYHTASISGCDLQDVDSWKWSTIENFRPCLIALVNLLRMDCAKLPAWIPRVTCTSSSRVIVTQTNAIICLIDR